MADFVRGIGAGDEMMIRDTGYWVEFWFHSDQYTWNNQQRWGQQSNGGYTEGTFALARGGGWHHVGSVPVGGTQDVLFRMFDSGLGWGTYDFWQRIERARVPDPPAPPVIGFVNQNSIRAWLNYGWDGGAGIDQAEIWWSDDPNNAKWLVGNTRDYQWYNLPNGKTYYFWGKTHNRMGWSGLSGRSQATTWRVPDPPTPVWFNIVRQRFIQSQFYGGWDGGTPVREWQLAYGRDPNTAQVYIWSNGVNDLDNLSPGQTYYFWARGRNDVGWGPWSPVRAQTLRAGGYVKVNGVWRRALPWVKVNGVWRLAKPHVKHAGVWKETL